MKIVHVRLTTAQLVASADGVAVPHDGSGLDVELRAGEEIVLSDLDGEFHGAAVVAVDGERTRPVYRVRVGARLPLDLVAERSADLDVEPERAGTHEIVDLLGELRAEWRQRQSGEQSGEPDEQ